VKAKTGEAHIRFTAHRWSLRVNVG